jgi:glycosyltransferase involved in cell wall biosynthesis
MKILTLVYSLGIGGTERAAVNYAVGYKNYGCDSKVLVLGNGFERVSDLNRAGIDPILVLKSDKTYDSIISDLIFWKPDIVHIHNFQKGLFVIINEFKLNGAKIIETNVFSRPSYTKEYRSIDLSMQLSMWGCVKFSMWIKNSNFDIPYILTPYIVNSENFLTNRIDLRNLFRERYNIPENAFLVGRIGQPLINKWSFSLIAIVRKLLFQDPNIYFVLVGVPDLIKNKLLADAKSFQSKIIFIDILIGDEALSEFYQAIDCFAHISKIGESFGYVIVEAMLFKVPVVSMLTPLKDNAQYEMIGNVERGVCVTSEKQFVAAILNLKNNVNLYTQMKLSLERWVESRFSESIIIPNLLIKYHAIINKSNTSFNLNKDLLATQFNLWGFRKLYLYPIFILIHNSVFYRFYLFLKNKL